MSEQNQNVFSPEEIRRNKFIVVYDECTKRQAIHLANVCSDHAVVTCWPEKVYADNECSLTNQNIIIFLSEKLCAENIGAPTLKPQVVSEDCVFWKDGKKYGIVVREIKDDELESIWDYLKDNISQGFASLWAFGGTSEDKPKDEDKSKTELEKSIGTIASLVVSGPIQIGVKTAVDKASSRAALKDMLLWNGINYFIQNFVPTLFAK